MMAEAEVDLSYIEQELTRIEEQKLAILAHKERIMGQIKKFEEQINEHLKGDVYTLKIKPEYYSTRNDPAQLWQLNIWVKTEKPFEKEFKRKVKKIAQIQIDDLEFEDLESLTSGRGGFTPQILFYFKPKGK